MTLKNRYTDIKDAHAALDRLSKNKALYRPHSDETLKLKKRYFHRMKGLEKQLKKESQKMKEKLSVTNLLACYYDPATKLSDLEFDVDGVKVLLKDVPTPDDADEYYFDDESLLSELIKNHEIEII